MVPSDDSSSSTSSDSPTTSTESSSFSEDSEFEVDNVSTNEPGSSSGLTQPVGEGKRTLLEPLGRWAARSKTPHVHVNALLKILKPFHPELPLDVRTLLGSSSDTAPFTAMGSEEPQRCHVPASPPKSSTDYVHSRNPSTAAGVLGSTLRPSNSKLRNNSPLRDIYSPLHAPRVMRSRPVKTARPTQSTSTHPLATVSQTADRYKYRGLSQRAEAFSAETTNRGKTACKQCTCQPSILPWNIQASASLLTRRPMNICMLIGSLNDFTNPSKDEFIYFVLESVREVEEVRRICPELCLSDEWLNRLMG
ncbi:hypothetical protein SprV_0200554600 [Sparganum proliferum]